MQISYDKDSAARGAKNSQGIVSGVHLGVFTLAELVTSSKKGTKGIEFTFKSASDDYARYLTLWIERADGTTLGYGQDQLQAIMTVIGCKGVEAKKVTAKKWDKGAKKEVDTQVDGFPDLCNKPLKVLFQEVLYTKGDGSDGSKAQMVQWFNAETGCNAIERLDGLVQGAEIIMASANDLPPKDERSNNGGYGGSDPLLDSPAPSTHKASVDFDDDLPF